MLRFCKVTIPLARQFFCFGDFFKHTEAFHECIWE
jgi:hypothetical protein